MKLRIGSLQINSQRHQFESNAARASLLLQEARPASMDILVLPELALTGYKYADRDDILPVVEAAGKGPSFEWAKNISQKLGCHTILGYPELDGSTIYNSAAIVSPQGDLVYNYRKTFLYETDEQWGCSEPKPETSRVPSNLQFATKLIPSLGVKVCLGICMDLNPYKFEAPFSAYEFARAAYRGDASLIICPMAWLASDSPNLKSQDKPKNWRPAPEGEPDSTCIQYWAQRMYPFIAEPKPRKIGFVTCNRSGWEDNVHYAGSSSIYGFEPDQQVVLYGNLGQDDEGFMLRLIEVD